MGQGAMTPAVVLQDPQVVQVQPSQWSTGLCECYKDMGDLFTCKVTSAVGASRCLPLLDCIGCASPASLAMRASVRERYGIQACLRLTGERVERLPVWMLLLSAILAPDLQRAEEKGSNPRLLFPLVSQIHCPHLPAGGALGLDETSSRVEELVQSKLPLAC